VAQQERLFWQYLAARRQEPTLPTGHTQSLSAAILQRRQTGFLQLNRLPGIGFPLPFPFDQVGPSPYTPNFPELTPILFLPFIPPFGTFPPGNDPGPRDNPDLPSSLSLRDPDVDDPVSYPTTVFPPGRTTTRPNTPQPPGTTTPGTTSTGSEAPTGGASI
jgi:hypothetical protein